MKKSIFNILMGFGYLVFFGGIIASVSLFLLIIRFITTNITLNLELFFLYVGGLIIASPALHFIGMMIISAAKEQIENIEETKL